MLVEKKNKYDVSCPEYDIILLENNIYMKHTFSMEMQHSFGCLGLRKEG